MLIPVEVGQPRRTKDSAQTVAFGWSKLVCGYQDDLCYGAGLIFSCVPPPPTYNTHFNVLEDAGLGRVR